MSKEEDKQHWEREWDRCINDPHYFFQEYFVSTQLWKLTEEAIKKDVQDKQKVK
jgi:hypothetical protein